MPPRILRAMLRITAGVHRGRKLKVPQVMATRPLAERAREGLMSHLAPLLEDAVIWDLYAGSGILGLEALSRGAAQVLAWEWRLQNESIQWLSVKRMNIVEKF